MEHDLAKYYFDNVSTFDGVRVWGPDFNAKLRSPTVSITSDKVSADQAVKVLGAQGLCLWQGHFYAQRVVELLGLAKSGGLIRMGLSMYNNKEEIDRLLGAIERLVNRPHSNTG